MTIWDWIGEFYRDAVDKGDEQRQMLPMFQMQAYKHRETDPRLAQSMFEEGGKLARQLNEPWWVMIYDHWRVTGLLFFQRDYRNVLDLAVQNALEVRKSQYDTFPLKFSILRDLVEAYIGIDPAAYLDSILQTLDHLMKEAPPDGSDRFLVHGSRRDLAIEMGWYDEALRLGAQFHEVAESLDNPGESIEHHAAFNYCGICEAAWHKRDFTTMEEAARAGEAAARESKLKMELSGCLVWQGVAARAAGSDDEAVRYSRQGVNQVSRLQMPADRGFFEALCAFHELAEEKEQILKVRRIELDAVKDRGRFAYESRTRNRICRILAEMFEPFDEELEQARSAARRLKKPEAALAELDQIAH
jgi:hypothetical protein